MMVVLYFSCNFDVVVRGGKYTAYLLCHLDQKLSFKTPPDEIEIYKTDEQKQLYVLRMFRDKSIENYIKED